MPRYQCTDRIRGLRPLFQPVIHALLIDVDKRRLRARIVVSEDLDEAAVARGARIGDDDAEERTLFGTCATKTNHNHLFSPHEIADFRLRIQSICNQSAIYNLKSTISPS